MIWYALTYRWLRPSSLSLLHHLLVAFLHIVFNGNMLRFPSMFLDVLVIRCHNVSSMYTRTAIICHLISATCYSMVLAQRTASSTIRSHWSLLLSLRYNWRFLLRIETELWMLHFLIPIMMSSELYLPISAIICISLFLGIGVFNHWSSATN